MVRDRSALHLLLCFNLSLAYLKPGTYGHGKQRTQALTGIREGRSGAWANRAAAPVWPHGLRPILVKKVWK